MNISHYQLQNKYRTKKNKLKSKKLFFLLLILIFILVFFYIKCNQRQIVQANYGEIVDGFKTEALIVRDEKSITAPISGKIVTHQQEGERVKYGSKIVDIKNSKRIISLYNNQSGIISYATDGLENIINTEIINKINNENYDSFKRRYKQLLTGNHVEKGSPVYRIINNYKLYLVIKTDAREAERYRNNELVFVRSESINVNLIKGYIINKKISGEDALLIIELRRFIEEWLSIRRAKIQFIKNIYRGIIIPEGAVFSQPRGDGVLVSTDAGNYKFKKVNIKHKHGDRYIVTGLEIGDNIISNPEKYDYGRGGMESGSRTEKEDK